jgi:hypothetical protein
MRPIPRDRDPTPTPRLGHPPASAERETGDEEQRASVRLSRIESSRVGEAAFSFLLSPLPCIPRLYPFPMSATRLSSASTKTMPAYMGSLRLAAVSEPGTIDKEFGSSSPAFSCSSSSPSVNVASSSPYTVPPRGALVFQQHVHRIPKPMRPSQKFKLWYRGIFWETLEPVSLMSLSERSTPSGKKKKNRLGEAAACRNLEKTAADSHSPRASSSHSILTGLVGLHSGRTYSSVRCELSFGNPLQVLTSSRRSRRPSNFFQLTEPPLLSPSLPRLASPCYPGPRSPDRLRFSPLPILRHLARSTAAGNRINRRPLDRARLDPVLCRLARVCAVAPRSLDGSRAVVLDRSRGREQPGQLDVVASTLRRPGLSTRLSARTRLEERRPGRFLTYSSNMRFLNARTLYIAPPPATGTATPVLIHACCSQSLSSCIALFAFSSIVSQLVTRQRVHLDPCTAGERRVFERGESGSAWDGSSALGVAIVARAVMGDRSGWLGVQIQIARMWMQVSSAAWERAEREQTRGEVSTEVRGAGETRRARRVGREPQTRSLVPRSRRSRSKAASSRQHGKSRPPSPLLPARQPRPVARRATVADPRSIRRPPQADISTNSPRLVLPKYTAVFLTRGGLFRGQTGNL